VLTRIKFPIMDKTYRTGDIWIETGDTLYPDDFQIKLCAKLMGEGHELYSGSANLLADPGVELVPGEYYVAVTSPSWFEKQGYHWLNIEPKTVPFEVPEIAGEVTFYLPAYQDQ